MYKLERFGTITLPNLNPSQQAGPVAARDGLIRTIVGVFDSFGSARAAKDLPRQIRVRSALYDDTPATWRTLEDALRAAVGTRSTLYRRALSDATVTQCTARLMDMNVEWSGKYRVECELQFLQLTPWLGAPHIGWTFDSGIVFDTGYVLDTVAYTVAIDAAAEVLYVANNGNLPCYDVVHRVTAGSGDITSCKISSATADLRWAGTIEAGHVLEINCSAGRVLYAAANGYEDFSLGIDHKLDRWFQLLPGNNLVRLDLTGTYTGATWAVEFADAWA